jgi:hypothetical protein
LSLALIAPRPLDQFQRPQPAQGVVEAANIRFVAGLWLIRSSFFVISQAVISNSKIMFEAYRRNSYRRVQ